MKLNLHMLNQKNVICCSYFAYLFKIEVYRPTTEVKIYFTYVLIDSNLVQVKCIFKTYVTCFLNTLT